MSKNHWRANIKIKKLAKNNRKKESPTNLSDKAIKGTSPSMKNSEINFPKEIDQRNKMPIRRELKVKEETKVLEKPSIALQRLKETILKE